MADPFKPVGEVLLPHRSGILSSSLWRHQRSRSRHNYRPRIQRARCLCWLSRRLLLFDELGAYFSEGCFHGACRRLHQWPVELSTLRHWRWNTTVCSRHDNWQCEDPHCKRLAARYRQTSCRKDIPVEIDYKTGMVNDENYASLSLSFSEWFIQRQLNLVNEIPRVQKLSLILLNCLYNCLQSLVLGNVEIHTFI